MNFRVGVLLEQGPVLIRRLGHAGIVMEVNPLDPQGGTEVGLVMRNIRTLASIGGVADSALIPALSHITATTPFGIRGARVYRRAQS